MAQRQQGDLEQTLAKRPTAQPPTRRGRPPRKKPIPRTAGAPIGIPTRIGKNYVVEGTDPDLRKGPGHYPYTPLPGERGTVAIAGHRTTYGAPFRTWTS